MKTPTVGRWERQSHDARPQKFLALWLGTKVDFAKMGLSFSRIFERMFGKKEMRILMVGLDAAGKVSFDTINTRLEAV